MNQSRLAALCGLSRTALSDRESGVKAVTVDELASFAEALDVSIAYLLGLSEERGSGVRSSAYEGTDEYLRAAVLLTFPIDRAGRGIALLEDCEADVVDLAAWREGSAA
jgi:transcriptional regulator with XRE-family HTH domain